MDLCLVTARPGLATNRLLGAAASRRGWRWSWKNPTQPAMARPHRALFRLGLTALEPALGLARQWEAQGVIVANQADAICTAKDKGLSHQAFEAADLPHVPTRIKAPDTPLAEVLDDLPGPWVVKTRYGAKGVGVFRAETPDEVAARAAPVHARGYDVLIQPCWSLSREWRGLVIHDCVLATVSRRAASGEFRANWHQGAQMVSETPSDELTALFVAGARAAGLTLAGVDVVEAGGRLWLLEVNDSPGLEGVTQVTGQDIAGRVLEAWESGA